ncbi:hypothetical protein EDC96DRAFT_540194 [Choanephora cucurbitarum]|nr:hypothetical protein EDC96DRAFT_540194 [Choanephora cucurbitarum]
MGVLDRKDDVKMFSKSQNRFLRLFLTFELLVEYECQRKLLLHLIAKVFELRGYFNDTDYRINLKCICDINEERNLLPELLIRAKSTNTLTDVSNRLIQKLTSIFDSTVTMMNYVSDLKYIILSCQKTLAFQFALRVLSPDIQYQELIILFKKFCN